jgi:TRAP-type C4-dicarboxylate transport system substrate-binding protein
MNEVKRLFSGEFSKNMEGRMKKFLLVILVCVFAGTFILAACGETSTTTTTPTTAPPSSPASTPVEPVVIKFGTDLPPTLPPVVGLHWWADEVTKATEGRVTVEMYPASSLCTQDAALESVLTGVADMYLLSISSHRKVFPISDITGLPGVGFPDETLEANTAHMNTFFELLDKYPAAAAEYKDFGPMFLYIIYSEAYLISKPEIRVPEDIKGLKVGSNGIRLELVEMMGGAPVTDIPPLAYEKLQTGVTDATFAAISAIHDFQIYEVTDYALNVPFGGGGMPCVINKDTWNKISAKDQQIMKDLAPQAAERSHVALADLNTLSWQEMVDFDMKVTATAEERALWDAEFAKLWDEWIDHAVAAGMSKSDAQNLLDWWKSKSDAEWVK